jgi:hypothetical protein
MKGRSTLVRGGDPCGSRVKTDTGLSGKYIVRAHAVVAALA